MAIQYVHTNIIAKNWKTLADFYVRVFGCMPVPPERNLSGDWVDRLTGMKNCHIRGVHLTLPGYADGAGPTLEIFSYEPEAEDEPDKKLNGFGPAHLAFHTDNVEETLNVLLSNGGTLEGDLVKQFYENVGLLTAVYARDPERNLIEIQNWSK